MTPYERYLYYLYTLENPVTDSTVVNSEENPLEALLRQSQGGDGQNNNISPINNPNNAGIYSIKDAMNFISNLPTPMNLGIKGITSVGNFLGNMFGPKTTPISEMYGYDGGSGDTGMGPGMGDPNASMGDTGMATGGDGGGVGSSSDAGAGSTDTCGSFKDGGYVALEINPRNFK
jgi:hypothetical protein